MEFLKMAPYILTANQNDKDEMVQHGIFYTFLRPCLLFCVLISYVKYLEVNLDRTHRTKYADTLLLLTILSRGIMSLLQKKNMTL